MRKQCGAAFTVDYYNPRVHVAQRRVHGALRDGYIVRARNIQLPLFHNVVPVFVYRQLELVLAVCGR